MLSVKSFSSTEIKLFITPINQGLCKSIFDDIDWFFLLEKHVFQQPKYTCCYLTVLEENNPILILPLVRPRRGKQSNCFRPSTINSNSNYYTSYFWPPTFSEKKDLQQAYLELSKYIKSHIKVDKITLKPFVFSSNTYQNTLNMLSRAGFYTFPYFMHGNWIKSLSTKSFNEYYSSLPSRLKNTIKRKEKKLIGELGEYRIDIVDKDINNLGQYISDFEFIYKKSWKRNEPYKELIRDLIKLHASKGALRLGVLYQDERPLAAQIWFIKNHTAYIFKLAYDPEYKQYSVGSILSKALFESAIDKDKIKNIDYLTGDESYKKDWMDQRRELWGIVAYNKFTIKGRTNAFIEKTKIAIKNYYALK